MRNAAGRLAGPSVSPRDPLHFANADQTTHPKVRFMDHMVKNLRRRRGIPGRVAGFRVRLHRSFEWWIMVWCYADMNSQTRNGSYWLPSYPGP